VVERCRSGLEPDRFLAMGQSVRWTTRLEQHLAQVRVSERVISVELDGSLKMSECLTRPVSFPQQLAQVIVSQREIGPEPKRTAELLGGLARPAQGLERQAEVGVGFGEICLKIERCTAASRRAVKLPHGTIGFSQVGMEFRTVWPESDRPHNQLDCNLMIALLVAQHAREMQRIRVVRLAIQDFLIELSGSPEIACSMHLDGRSQYIAHKGNA
jgi:hypothetical protein